MLIRPFKKYVTLSSFSKSFRSRRAPLFYFFHSLFKELPFGMLWVIVLFFIKVLKLYHLYFDYKCCYKDAMFKSAMIKRVYLISLHSSENLERHCDQFLRGRFQLIHKQHLTANGKLLILYLSVFTTANMTKKHF